MALAATERYDTGRVHDTQARTSLTPSTGALPAGSYTSGGYVRDVDGRWLVVVETLGAAASAGSYLSGGYLRDSLGRICVAQSSGALTGNERLSGGEVFDTAGRIVLVSGTLGAAPGGTDLLSGGLRDAVGRRYAAGLSGGLGTYATAVMVDTPLLYWRLGEASGVTAADASGTSHTGTYVNAPTLGATGALTDTDTAVSFAAGSLQYVQGGAPTNATDNVALEFWVKLPTLTNFYGTLVANSSNNNCGYGMIVNSVSSGSGLNLSGILPGVAYLATTYTFADTNWHHVVFTRESGTWKCYVDAVAKTVTPSGSAPGVGTISHTTVAGRHSTGTTFNENSTVLVDEVAVYGTALTAARVSAHFAAR